MGLYDRDYGRDQPDWQPGVRLGGPRTLTTNIVLVCFAVYVVQLLTNTPPTRLTPGDTGWFTNLFSLRGDALTQPWRIFEFLTYGFLHSPNAIEHIAFNMVGLWFLGRAVEGHYGRKEYLAFYLAAILFAGCTWYAGEFVANGSQVHSSMLGASGGLTGVVILFVLNFPKQTLYIWGVLPIPSWALGLLVVGQDIYGSINHTSNVAYTAHLGGALFAFLYFRYGWKLARWMPGEIKLPKRKPKLRIHAPTDAEAETDRRVDEILGKLNREGPDSLTRSEKRFLEKASKQYRNRRKT